MVSIRSGVESGRPNTNTMLLWGHADLSTQCFHARHSFCFNPYWIDGGDRGDRSHRIILIWLAQLHSGKIVSDHHSSRLAGFRVTSSLLLQPFFSRVSQYTLFHTHSTLSPRCTPHPSLPPALRLWRRPPHRPSPEPLRVSLPRSPVVVMPLRSHLPRLTSCKYCETVIDVLKVTLC